MNDMYSTFAWAKNTSKESKFSKIEISRNVAGENDVTFEMKFCGICHSDVHVANNDFGMTNYPCVPGHELAGIVTEVGKNVRKVKIGDKVGVGCIVDSCMNCKQCEAGDENYCTSSAGRMTSTYNGLTVHGHIKTNKHWTFGGYSGSQTVHQRYIIKIPDDFPLEAAGPVFCAGITMYSPLCNWNVGTYLFC